MADEEAPLCKGHHIMVGRPDHWVCIKCPFTKPRPHWRDLRG